MRHGLRAALGMVSLVLPCAMMPAEAAKPKIPPKRPPAALVRPARVNVSIPYPNAGMYLYRGIYGSFAGGRSVAEAQDSAMTKVYWDDPLFQWQGQVEYFYTTWFSGGVAFRINAGSPSDSEQTVRNRYYLVTRFHKAVPSAAAYVGARIGVDDVNFSLRSQDTLDLEEPFRETNATVGLEAGGGWKLSRYVGVTLGQRMDVSLVRQSASNPHRAVTFQTQPGLALDMLRVYPSLETNVKAFYLLAEAQFGQSLPERGVWSRQFAWITGLSLAF